eukprot:3553302-Amphidinium_carterae.1
MVGLHMSAFPPGAPTGCALPRCSHWVLRCPWGVALNAQGPLLKSICFAPLGVGLNALGHP